MTYAVSNLHGCYSSWLRLAKEIGFGDKDIMFVLGDSVDIGDESMELISEFSYASNIWHVAGEHDRKAFRMLSGYDNLVKTGKTPDTAFITEMQEWIAGGGKNTFDSFRELDDEAKEGILEYLGDLPLFEETKVGERHFIFMNNGISGFIAGTDPDDYDDDAFFGDSPVKKINGFTVVVGHRDDLREFRKDTEIYHGDGYIAIDCGLARGGRLGCIRLDDGKEFYV